MQELIESEDREEPGYSIILFSLMKFTCPPACGVIGDEMKYKCDKEKGY
jgi:hypothetical protein